MKYNSCNLCQELAGNLIKELGGGYPSIVSSRKNRLLESENFVLIPSAGPLNESHAMLVPKEHVESFAALSSSMHAEAETLLSTIQNWHQLRYRKRLIFFESGAGRLTSHSGACIIHAHIHCVTASTDFHETLMKEVKLQPRLNNSLDINHGYIWYRDESGCDYYKNNPLLPSQFLRFTYAQCSDEPSKWNWRRYVNASGMLNVIKHYEAIAMGIAVHQKASDH